MVKFDKEHLMSSVGHLPVHFTGIEECPEPFREPLKRAIGARETIYDIIYSPPFISGRSSMPGSVFCVVCISDLMNAPVQFKEVTAKGSIYSIFSGGELNQEFLENPWNALA
jgi:hypothetical protein